MIQPSPQCQRCAHYQGVSLALAPAGTPGVRARPHCNAFPDTPTGGIPLVIWTGDFDHRLAFAGDGGRRWMPLLPGVIHPRDEPPPQTPVAASTLPHGESRA